jgi:hypothetical protein
VPGHELGDGVGKPKEALLEVGAVEGEEDVEHVLGGLDVADRQVGLQEVEPGGRPVPAGVVVRRHELDQLAHVAAHAEVARDGHQHVGAGAGAGQHLLVDGDGARHIPRLQLGPRIGEARQGAAGDALAGVRFRGRVREKAHGR